MTSGRPRPADRRAALRALLAAALLAAAAPALAAWDLAALMALIAANPAGKVRFHETRTMALLDQPLESTGELEFKPPRRLERRTLSPGREVLVADGDMLEVERGGRRHSMPTKDLPEVAVFVDTIRAALSGDGPALEASYTVSVAGRREAWTLTLLPKALAAKLVTRIDIRGAEAAIQRIEIGMVGGDRSVMTILSPKP